MAWLAAANSRPDWGPVPTEEQLDVVRASADGALAYVETMTDEPVPTERSLGSSRCRSGTVSRGSGTS